MIYVGIDMLMLMANWQNYMAMTSGNFILTTMVYIMAIFYVFALYVSYKAYSCFKKEYIN